MELRKLLVIVGALLLVAVAAVVLFARKGARTVEWTVIAQLPAAGQIIAEGRVSDAGLFEITSPCGGSINKVFAAEGTIVDAGDTLVLFDDKTARIRRDRCANDVAIATVRLEQHSSAATVRAREKVRQAQAVESLAEKKSARSDSVFRQGSISRAELDEISKELALAASERAIADAELAAATTGAVKLLQLELAQARLALETAEMELSQTAVPAPADGRACDVLVRPGMRVAAATPLLRLMSADTLLDVVAKVDEEDIPRLREGLAARIGFWGRRPVDAAVKSIAGRIDALERTGTVVLSVRQAQPPLLPGQRVFVRIDAGDSARGPLLLDRRFCNGTPDAPYVYVKQGGRAVRRAIRCRMIGDDLACIRRGVAAGDTVVMADGLSDNSAVRLHSRPAEAPSRPVFD